MDQHTGGNQVFSLQSQAPEEQPDKAWNSLIITYHTLTKKNVFEYWILVITWKISIWLQW